VFSRWATLAKLFMVSEREFKLVITSVFLQGPNPTVPRDLTLRKLRFDLAGMSFHCFNWPKKP
jgi:hypothetical protein